MRQISKKVVVVGVVVGFLAATCTTPSDGQVDERPNILLVITDDQDFRSLWVMPTVKELVQRGTKFTRAFAPVSNCCPARATIFTGQYAHNHDVTRSTGTDAYPQFLDEEPRALPVALQQAGYETALVGKYLNGYPVDAPVPPGWDHWWATISSLKYIDPDVNIDGTATQQKGHVTELLTETAVDTVRRFGSRPWFLVVSHTAPHYSGGEDRMDGPVTIWHQDDFPWVSGPRLPSVNEEDVSDKPGFIRWRSLLSADELRRIGEHHRRRLRSLADVDDSLTMILNEVRDRDELDNTLIIFISDNGFMAGHHRLKTGKEVAYEESVRIPMVIAGPSVPEGRRRSGLVGLHDLAPTILDVAGGTPLLEPDGVSLADDWVPPKDRPLLLSRRNSSTRSWARYWAVRTFRYLWVEYDNGDRELYDLKYDPYQEVSRHDDPGLENRRRLMTEYLDRLVGCAGDDCR